MAKDDAFGSSGKTVIRPNPGGAFRGDPIGERGAGQSGQSGLPAPQRTVIADRFDPFAARPSAAPGASRPSSDDWLQGGRQAPPSHLGLEQSRETQAQAPVPRIPLDVALGARGADDVPSVNPITAAAAPLLILLGRLRLMIVDMQARPLMRHVGDEIESFERRLLAGGIPDADARTAKYALCATADDIVQNITNEDAHVWTQYSMLAQFFQKRDSGVAFFRELDELRKNPALHYDLLELMHACLSLGFEGQYRGARGGDVELQKIRRDVYQTLRHLRGRADDDISPRWQGLNLGNRNMRPLLPGWLAAGFAGAGLVAVYFALRFLLVADSEAVAATLVSLHPSSSITIVRPAFEPLREPLFDEKTTQIERIRAALAPEIAAGTVAVEALGDDIVMRLDNLILFESGKADTKPEFAPVATRIAAMLEAEPGRIFVTGHSDNVRLKASSRFASNFDLSVKRAEAVAALLQAGVSDQARFVVAGKGDAEAIASNATAEGRRQNRRVELMIPKEETLAATAGVATK